MTIAITSSPSRSFRKKVFPISSASVTKAEIQQNPCLLELEDAVRSLQPARADEDKIRAAQNKAGSYRSSLTSKTLKAYQFKWVWVWKIVTRGKQSPGHNGVTVQLGILSRIVPERGRLARAMVSE